MRIWLIVLSFANLATVIGCYAYLAHLFSSHSEEGWMTVRDWTTIIFSLILFVSYVYSFRGKRVLEKHMRVFWMLIPCLTLMGIGFDYISVSRTFECSGGPDCIQNTILPFAPAVTGLFSLIEIGMAYAWGPLQPKNRLYSSLGYNTAAQVMIVSPNQPQPQMVYTQQPGLVAPQPSLQPLQNYYYQQPAPVQQQQQPSNLVGPLSTNDHPNSINPTGTVAAGAMAQPYQYTDQQQQYRSFAQPAPLQQQQQQPQPNPQPSPGATTGTHYSPAAAASQPSTSA
ncbi:hypothetical protein BGZ97_007384 [Linnemannia gamsii]|jgi:hypothetical protein|uniref:Uncharacterized protein n=1 Tax=Linnemannia gamsii TaxID=64522 RepID=A0A9P6UF53_9FUNG|nr:hypothetical protein BGZ97_007384 [Linnemannia gamsii]